MQLVIFDCDGALVDSQHLIYQAMATAFDRIGLAPPPRDIVRSVIGLSLVEAVTTCLPDQQDAGDPVAIASLYKAAFTELRADPANEEPLYPGTRETLQHLANQPDTILAVATGKCQRGMTRLFEREGLGHFFQSVQTADEHPSKPHPSMITRAMELAGVDAHRTIMVGDTTYDIAMAVNAGVHAVGVSWGYHASEDLTATGAATVIERFDALPEQIDTLLTDEGA